MTWMQRRIERWWWVLDALFLSLVAAGMLVWSWQRWLDPVSDVGRELYVPWQLAKGKVLYRDIAHFNGPLSQYLNAVAFMVLGASLRSLVIANLVVIGVTTLLLHRIVAFVANRWIALFCGFMFLTVFAFPPYPVATNYNFITPYSHEITHGALFSLAAIWAMVRFVRFGRPAILGWCGGFLGLVFLTKPEVFLAAGVSVGLTMAFYLALERRTVRVGWSVLWFVSGFAVPVMLAGLLLWTAMPLGEAVEAVRGGWRYAFNPRLIGLPFYRRMFGTIGTRAYPASTWIMFWAAYSVVFIGMAVLAAVGVGRAIRRHFPTPPRALLRSIEAISFGALLTAALVTLRGTAWDQTLRAFPLLLAVLVLAHGGVLLFKREGRAISSAALAFSLYALVLLAKIALNTQLYYYGFVLAMPALMVVSIGLVKWMPDCLARLAGPGARAVMRGLGLAAVTALLLSLLHGAVVRRSSDWIAMGSGPNRFRAEKQFAGPINALLAHLGTSPGGATLAVLPEGAAINFLSGRVNPTPYHTLLPPEYIMFGEERIFIAYRDNPPDYIALLQRSTKEYGPRGFGHGYAGPIYSWIRSNYHPVWRNGGDIESDDFGILLLERNTMPGS